MPPSIDFNDPEQAQRALQLTQLSVHVAAEAMFVIAEDGGILNVNETACEHLKYSRDELLGMSVADINPHFSAASWRQRLEEMRRNRKMTFEAQHRDKDGRVFDVEVCCAYFQFEGGEYFCSSVRDITKRKQTEHIVRLQHEVLAEVASTCGDLPETLDAVCRLVEELVPDSMATVMLMDASDGCLRFEAGPGLTDEIREALEPLKPAAEAGSCGTAAFLKRPVIVEDTRTSPKWTNLQHIVERFHLLACWSLPILDERNQALGTVAISHQKPSAPTDYHRLILATASHMASIAIGRKRFERQLQTAHEELARASQLSTIGEMATSIAHELNQPLAAIANNAFVFEKKSADDLPDLTALREHASNIRGQAMRAGEIIRSIRDLVKKNAPTRAVVSPNEIVRKSLQLLEPELRSNGILLRKQLKESVPTLHVDGVQIQQVLANLIRNAIDAMQDVNREERILTVNTDTNESNEIEIHVSDTGQGLCADEMESVFDAFYTTKQEGMGMGLAISRSIAEAHSGRLVAGRAGDRGAVFSMYLPLEPQGYPR